MSTPVVVTGMHRSGTSLLANLLQEAGVFMGDDLIGATASNQRGHFEDAAFVELHDAVLAANGTSMYLENLPPQLTVGAEYRDRAAELIARRKSRSIWGWKDPRTTLLLDFWLNMLPEAKFVFIFRPPEQVVDSLRRRSDAALTHHFHGAWPLRRLGLPMFKMKQALNLWRHYNCEIVRFVTEHSDQSCVVNLDDLAAQLPAVLGRMRDRWRLDLKRVNLSSVFEDGLLRSTVNRRVAAACRRQPEIARTHERLQGLAHR